MKAISIFLFTFLLLQSCIEDDIINDRIDPILSITNKIDSIELNTAHNFRARYLNEVGLEEEVDVVWESSNPDVISVSSDGRASALALGFADIFVSYNDGDTLLVDGTRLHVTEAPIVVAPKSRSGSIRTTSSYTLRGDFALTEADDHLILSFEDNYAASSALPGLYVYLSNNQNRISDAFEIGAVHTFSGAHSYEIEGVELNQYRFLVYFCKPFNVKVGDGTINN